MVSLSLALKLISIMTSFIDRKLISILIDVKRQIEALVLINDISINPASSYPP